MRDAADARVATMQAFEREAELLVVHQLDLLSQMEAQLRAVHHTLRRIEQLRSAKLRIGPELTNGQRQFALMGLSAEVAELVKQIAEEGASCAFMQNTIQQMQSLLTELKNAAAFLEHSPLGKPDEGGSLDAR